MVRTLAFHVGNTGSIPVSFSIMVMGALTSKPYAFTARPWELRTVYSLDFLDGLTSKIRLDLRGIDVMRVLPVVLDQITDEWITDKIRFSYDAVKRQRLLQVLLKTVDNSFYSVSLRDAFTKIYQSVKANNFKNIVLISGKAQDIETLFSSKIWARSWFLKTHFLQDCFEDHALVTFFRLKNTFFLPTLDTHINKANYVFLVGTNLRYESPLLNLRLKNVLSKRDLLIFSFGAFIKNTFSFFNIGSNLVNLLLFLKGRSPISTLIASKVGLVLFGNFFFEFKDVFEHILSVENGEVRAQLVYVSAFSSLLNMFATNFITQRTGLVNSLANALVLNLQADDFQPKGMSGTNVFFGSHGTTHSECADYIFPTAHFFEKKFNLLNFLGDHLQAQQAILPKGSVRSEISYFYALDKFFYFSSMKDRFTSPGTYFGIYYLSLFFCVKGFLAKPVLNRIKNRWKNLYNPSFGRLLTYNKVAKFGALFKTKNMIIKMEAFLVNRYINNYMFTHTFTKASHFLAVANTRYSYNNNNFNYV